MTAKRQSEICEGYSFAEEETQIFHAIKSFSAPLPDRQEGSLEFLSQEMFSAPVPVIQPSTEISYSRKRRKVMDPEALTAIIKQAAMEATEANKISFGSIVQGHLQTMKNEILTEVDVKLSPIAERVAKLETEWKSAGGGGGGGGGGGSSNASTFVPGTLSTSQNAWRSRDLSPIGTPMKAAWMKVRLMLTSPGSLPAYPGVLSC